MINLEKRVQQPTSGFKGSAQKIVSDTAKLKGWICRTDVTSGVF